MAPHQPLGGHQSAEERRRLNAGAPPFVPHAGIYIYMYMCIYICTCTYIYIYMYIYIYTYIYMSICLYIHTYIYIYIYVYVFSTCLLKRILLPSIHSKESKKVSRANQKTRNLRCRLHAGAPPFVPHAGIYIFAYMYIYIYVHIYIYVCLYVYTYIHLYIHICICIQYMSFKTYPPPLDSF